MGVRRREIADITRNNLSDCKKIISMVDDARHLGGVASVFGVSDIEFIAPIHSCAIEESKKMQFIYSDSEVIVEQKQRIFNALWEKAVPAQSRIDELEGKVAASATSARPKTLIDRIHACLECKQTFIYRDEAEEHKTVTGHENFREYSLV